MKKTHDLEKYCWTIYLSRVWLDRIEKIPLVSLLVFFRRALLMTTMIVLLNDHLQDETNKSESIRLYLRCNASLFVKKWSWIFFSFGHRHSVQMPDDDDLSNKLHTQHNSTRNFKTNQSSCLFWENITYALRHFGWWGKSRTMKKKKKKEIKKNENTLDIKYEINNEAKISTSL